VTKYPHLSIVVMRCRRVRLSFGGKTVGIMSQAMHRDKLMKYKFAWQI
jgi:hypothetical protein